MKTKYGKVYVLHRDTGVDGSEIILSKLLESTFFSNIDFKWYDGEGNLSPFYEKYKGRSFAVQFNFNQMDKNGQEVNLHGQINLPYKVGEIGHQDFENVQKATKEMETFWKNHGVLSDDMLLKDDGYNTFRKAQSASVIASLCPGWKISNFRTFHVWMDPFFILDDHTDKSASQKDMPFKISNCLWSALLRILEGKPFEVGRENEDQKFPKIPEQYMKMVKGMEEVRKLIVEKKGDPTYLIQTYKNMYNALSIENCTEWKQKQCDPSSKLYEEAQQGIRAFTCGVPIAIELILFDKGIQISEKVRQSFLFKLIIDLSSKQCSLVNDIISLKKEMDMDSTSNMVYIWHCRDDRLSLQDVCDKTVERINFLEKVVHETGELLVTFFGKEGAAVWSCCKDAIYGTTQWHAITNRYHMDTTYDCIVKIE